MILSHAVMTSAALRASAWTASQASSTVFSGLGWMAADGR